MKIYIEFIKQWSRSCRPGITVAFDEAKGRRVIAAGFAKEVPEPKSVGRARKKDQAKAEAEAKAKADAEAKAKAEAETATIVPAAETTDARPGIKDKPKPGKKK